ncbi:hypothetical protein PtA15_8A600 [Puccinia triticina]|uniref:Uncharacterized protein n=1 Tax=Puccinia triticina TaxID=208348 RepID=A0ABY7CR55_9BASI|nr:uncharacterized protein PtA15_8A600 [Puccinia triticina]WAQ87694.1 hypothetical protein PtA15_8A600 [Puccinia triticina]
MKGHEASSQLDRLLSTRPRFQSTSNPVSPTAHRKTNRYSMLIPFDPNLHRTSSNQSSRSKFADIDHHQVVFPAFLN